MRYKIWALILTWIAFRSSRSTLSTELLEPNPDAKGTIDLYKDCGVRRGYTFKGGFYGVTIEGQVEMIEPSQLGVMSVDIKVVTEDVNN